MTDPPFDAGAAHVRTTPPVASTVAANAVGAVAVANGKAVAVLDAFVVNAVIAVTRK
jgi:hypothetical protein